MQDFEKRHVISKKKIKFLKTYLQTLKNKHNFQNVYKK